MEVATQDEDIAQTNQTNITNAWLTKSTQKISITSGAFTPDVTLLEIIKKVSGFQI